MPTRLCAESGCPHPATTRARCHAHARSNDRNIHRAGHKIYRTKRWQLLRRQVLRDQPLCPGLDNPCGDIATDVDHIVPLSEGGDPWRPDGLQALCQSCHAQKTRREQAR